MNASSIVALDIGGSKINVGKYQDNKIVCNHVSRFCASASAEVILQFIIDCIEQVSDQSMVAIAIGVPSIVDVESGTVFDAVNIEAWQTVELKSELEQHFSIPVYINNDVNCFVAGEHHSGVAKDYDDVVGLCLGTGFGVGFIFNNQLYMGQNCSAGELGGLSYLEKTIDDYCSGQFFLDNYGIGGDKLAESARQGDEKAKQAFVELGKHLAHAIKTILLVVDPQLIVLGGSVSISFDLFIDSLQQELVSFPYQRVIDNLKIVQSEQSNSALIGAAQLYLQHQMVRS